MDQRDEAFEQVQVFKLWGEAHYRERRKVEDELTALKRRHDDRQRELLEANNREVERRREALAQVAALREVGLGCLASLVAAIDLLGRGGKKAAPSDKMFEVMLEDYRRSVDKARAVLTDITPAVGGPR
jgi:hypothetical protein